ncbi:hypothetical protein VTI74DRAFT_6177 [Chaetomium olivicolor]
MADLADNYLYWRTAGITGLVSRALIRTLQGIGAVVTAILYGIELRYSSMTRKDNSAWFFAEVASGVSLAALLCHLFFTTGKARWMVVDWIIFIFWVALFGTFGSIYIGASAPQLRDHETDASRQRMQAAVWIDMINMLLWFASSAIGIRQYSQKRRERRRQRVAATIHMQGINAGSLCRSSVSSGVV